MLAKLGANNLKKKQQHFLVPYIETSVRKNIPECDPKKKRIRKQDSKYVFDVEGI